MLFDDRLDEGRATVVAGAEVGVEPPPALGALERAYVAVLTGARTVSSGEAVTLAFRGRPRTRSFGRRLQDSQRGTPTTTGPAAR